jgi:GH18 family chitinase
VFVLIDAEDEEPSRMQRVCYITNWSRYRPGEAKFEVEFIDPFMCSHIIYAYATVDERKPEIIPIQKDDLG